MKVYILEVQGKNREQILEWLRENKKIERIEAFDDYIQFVEQAGKSPPDFCIIRIGYDRIPGFKSAEMIRQISPDMRIVFISDDRGYAVYAYEAGAFDYLLCPVERNRFEGLLKDVDYGLGLLCNK